jgi:AraC-like DNA-binding protein
MLDMSQMPSIPFEAMLGAGPLPQAAGPVRLHCNGTAPGADCTALREVFSRIGYRYDIERIPGECFEADFAVNLLPDVMMLEGHLHGSRNRRTRAIIEDQRDEAALLINLQGPHLIEQFGREVVLDDGDAILVSGTDPSCFTHKPPGNILGIRMPKSRLAPLLKGGDGAYMNRIPAASAALALLRNYVELTWNRHLAGDVSLGRMMADHLIELLALAVGATRDATEMARGNGLHAARFSAVTQDIERNLGDQGLSVAGLAHRHGLTPRAVQRLFEAEGTTFTAHLLERRLAEAHRVLRLGAEKITAVAYDCGFGDVSYFNRAFRRRYGAAPSEVRSAALSSRG